METKEKTITPFSNGTEAMMWLDSNCDRCTKAYHPDDKKGWASEATLLKYVKMGKYCKLQYDIDVGFITSEIPMETAIQIGTDGHSLNQQCMFFSDNEDDGFKHPKTPKPDNSPNNQLVMPFMIEDVPLLKSAGKELQLIVTN